ncbi:MAG: polyprenyl synthetase family protein [Myxococcales bacterium]|nr:polyprenyl synthetase family protein [Myxococcales bacterium]MBL0193154.1 polyprenyl synthetase family protein [Myxococcales bacterium]
MPCSPRLELHPSTSPTGAAAPLQIRLQARIESALRAHVTRGVGPGCPPRLAAAQLHALFPGGQRLRPSLCLVVALAEGDARPRVATGAAVAVELLHAASLVHDDLPCFDDAPTRRGLPSVHARFGEPLAVLTGDALIAQSFEALGLAIADAPGALPALPGLLAALATAAGTTRGLLAGQAWESEPSPPLEEYHRAKTASLFEAAAAMGAIAAGASAEPWRAVGELVGLAYQAADDVRDAVGDEASLGKPTGQDAARGRPSVVRANGLEGARRRVREHLDAAALAVPRCMGAVHVHAWLAAFGERLGGV